MTQDGLHFYDAISFRGQVLTYRAQFKPDGSVEYVYAWIEGRPVATVPDIRAAILADIGGDFENAQLQRAERSEGPLQAVVGRQRPVSEA